MSYLPKRNSIQTQTTVFRLEPNSGIKPGYPKCLLAISPDPVDTYYDGAPTPTLWVNPFLPLPLFPTIFVGLSHFQEGFTGPWSKLILRRHAYLPSRVRFHPDITACKLFMQSCLGKLPAMFSP